MKPLNIILLRHIIGWYRVTNYICMHFKQVVCYNVIKNLSDLHKIPEFNQIFGHINNIIYTKLHIFTRFEPLNKTDVFLHNLTISCNMSQKSLVYQIWYKTWKTYLNIYLFVLLFIFFYRFCLKVKKNFNF